jgi:hypothetical protein
MVNGKIIRQWAINNGVPVPTMGPVPKWVRAKYARRSEEDDRVVVDFHGKEILVAKKYLLEAANKTLEDELARVEHLKG